MIFKLGFTGPEAKNAAKLIRALYTMYWETDAAMIEVNPLITTPTGDVLALDAKVSFDDNALFRHPEIVSLRDLNEEDPKEIEASKYSLSYIALDGNIACLVNGAGLAMSTMDIIKHFGGTPANFLDVGGGASKDQVIAAFKIILGDPNVKGILVNIFGGIMDCNVIATGIVEAVKEVGLKKLPLVVRLEGNNVAAGKAHARQFRPRRSSRATRWPMPRKKSSSSSPPPEVYGTRNTQKPCLPLPCVQCVQRR